MPVVWWDGHKRSDAGWGLNTLPGRSLNKERDQTLARVGPADARMYWVREGRESCHLQPSRRKEGRLCPQGQVASTLKELKSWRRDMHCT